MPHLTERDLQALGVLLGHRRILLAAIAGLAEPQPLALGVVARAEATA